MPRTRTFVLVRGIASWKDESSHTIDVLFELPASGIDVCAARVPNGCLHAHGVEPTDELLRASVGCRAELAALHLVEFDQVHVGQVVPTEVTEGGKLLLAVVDTLDECIFVGGPAPRLVHVFAHDVIEVEQGVLAHAWHEHVSCALHGRVEGYGEGELLGFVCEALDHGNDATGGNGEVSSADSRTLG